MLLNLASNAAWLPVFQNELGQLWVSVGVIAGGILAPLMLLHWRSWRRSALESASWGEAVCVLPFISLYMGWVSVATILNVSLALTPPGTVVTSLSGLGAEWWSVAMMGVAALLAVVVPASTRFRDWIYPLPIAWALAAIGVRQRDPAYPGGETVVNAAFSLSALVGVWGLLLAVIQAVKACRAWAAKRSERKRSEAAGGKSAAVVVGNPAQFTGASQPNPYETAKPEWR